ncbi:MAG: DUF2889 domain-containing protein [Deltaproteobacteria bacterium]|nr:DUF2889 domain-containing protein [Deltaproteobacteria bacterium]
MKLDVSGHPLHSRVLTINLTAHGEGKFNARGILLDLRKTGFLPLTGNLQPSGIVHHMQLDVTFDPAERTLETVKALQPTVAYESSSLTQMENCRDTIAAIEALSETRLDDQYAGRLNQAIGGPRGCTHLLTLAQLLGSSLDWFLNQEGEIGLDRNLWSPGERVFQRTLTLDGFECDGGAVKMAIQLADLHLKPATATAFPMDHFSGQFELRILLEIDMNTMSINGVTAAKRRRNVNDIAGARWQDLKETVEDLAGLGLMTGMNHALFRRFGNQPSQRPLLDALLNLTPGIIQCIGSMSEGYPLAAQENHSLLGMGKEAPVEDACYMWRKEGALIQIRKRENMDHENEI